MPRCSFCGEQYEFPRGLTLVMTDGKINHLCSGKCRKNMKMKRRKVRWINKKAVALAREEISEEKKVEVSPEAKK